MRWGKSSPRPSRIFLFRVARPGENRLIVKKFIFVSVFVLSWLASPASLIAQSPALSTPTREELESVIGGMGLSMGEKLSLRSILQGMREQGEKVQANGSLSTEQKVTQITKIRQDALAQTQKILTAPQQQQLVALLLPK